MLGPGAGRHHHRPGRPGRRRDQGGAARRRLHPRDDVAHRRGHVPHAPAPQPRQALPGARPAHRRRRRHPEGTGRRRRRRGGGHAARCAGTARRRLRRPAGPQPEDRLLQHLGLRHDRPVPGLPEPRRGLRHLGRHRQRRHRRRGLRLHSRARLHRHQRRPALRRARHPGRGDPGPRDGESSFIDLAQSDAAARWTGTAPRPGAAYERPAVRGDREQGRRLRTPRPGHRRHGGGRALPGLRDRR